jgi:hypothetical protein
VLAEFEIEVLVADRVLIGEARTTIGLDLLLELLKL